MDDIDGLGYGKQPFYKRIWFWVLVIILIILLGISLGFADLISISQNTTTIQDQRPIVKSSTQIIQGFTAQDGTINNKNAKETTLTEGKFIVGKDIPQGIYIAQTTMSGTINVYNSNGQKLQENSIVEKGSQTPLKSIIMLKDGDAIDIQGMRSVKFVPYTRDYKTILNQGVYTIGTDVEQGNYMMEIPTGTGMISINNPLGMTVFSEMLNNNGAQNIKITLVNGDMIIVNGISGIHLVNIDNNQNSSSKNSENS